MEIEQKGAYLLPIRANAVLVSAGDDRKLLIGGLTMIGFCSEILQIRYVAEPVSYQLKQLKFIPNLIKAKHSFAACSGQESRIFLWGGMLEMGVSSDIVEIDTDKLSMKFIKTKEPLYGHSSSLVYSKKRKQLIAYGGIGEKDPLGSTLFILSLEKTMTEQNSLPFWEKHNLHFDQHKNCIWQHSAHLSKDEEELIVVGNHIFYESLHTVTRMIVKYAQYGSISLGGCSNPMSPYRDVVSISLKAPYSITKIATLSQARVSHASVLHQDALWVFGGSVGGELTKNRQRILISNLKSQNAQKQQMLPLPTTQNQHDQKKLSQQPNKVVSTSVLRGHPALGCCAIPIQQGILVYGGVVADNIFSACFLYPYE